ncbi:MAG TPA: DUF2339 domain-containing protein [Verrucomicrobiae bacterium]|nr:DUF2339 domain-containing protein [Verrucomicrobiae bacterium]
MEQTVGFIILVVVCVPIAIAIWVIARLIRTGEQIDELSRRLSTLESETLRLRQRQERETAGAPQPPPAARREPVPTAPVTPPTLIIVPQAIAPLASPPDVPPRIPPAARPSVFAELSRKREQAERIAGQSRAGEKAATSAEIPPLIGPTPEPTHKPATAINWEQFMGVKGFAWLGGFALFLGVALFIKYSFDNNLVPPTLRVAIGFVAGLGLVVGGVVMSRRKFPALSQTLCATGVVILYAVTFACHSIYHFPFFSLLPTFALMAVITTAAFLLAVRLDALVVAILGMLGGFLTPILLSTGQDNPPGLFGYIAILDTGLIVIALHKRWHFLVGLAALGTALMELGWASEFFVPEQYFEGNKIFEAFAVLLGFNALWLAAQVWSKSRNQINPWLSGSALGLVAGTFIFAAWFLNFPSLAGRPWLMFSFIFLVDLAAVAIAFLDENVSIGHTISGFAVFVLLGMWTQTSLSDQLLIPALIFYFIFATLHSALPTLLQWRRGVANPASTQGWGTHLFPIFSLSLVLVPIFRFEELSFIVWPFILLVDLLAILLAVLTATLLPVLAVLLLTLAAIGALIFKIPADLMGLPISFSLFAAFIIFFVCASLWLVKKFMPAALKGGIQFGKDLASPADVAAILPACSIILPFLLLIMATLRLPLSNPTPVFGLALLLVVLLLGATKLFSLDWMPAIGLVSLTAVECAWHFNHFDPENPNQPLDLVLAWYLLFFALFSVFPFLFLRQFQNKVIPWATSAMAGLPQFSLIHRFIKVVWPNQVMGLVPAAFAIPGLLGLTVVLKRIPSENKARLAQLAWFGGVALFFITLIFPIQFEREWITLGWALEGAALLWLFHRVPHPGLRLVGFCLLVAAFVRLAVNPAVLDYHARSNAPIFNWYLYSYGIVTVALFIGARLLAPPRNTIVKTNARPILAALGTVLAFLLMNIEIADYFSAPGSTLTFEFSGNFARDMTYSIAWALFALLLLMFGIFKNSAGTRYSAMGLLCVTLLKLFFHDLAQIGQLYRIAAFVCVAGVAMLASFAYQKFFLATAKKQESKDDGTMP